MNGARHEHRFDAIGTTWCITSPRELSAECGRAVADEVERFDRVWSRFRDDSLVHEMAMRPGVWPLPDEAGALFTLYRHLYEVTDARVTPLVGRALEQHGLDAAYSLRPAATIDDVPKWDDAIAWDGATLTTLRPVVLDVGAAGKGLLVDRLAAELRDHGVGEYVVDGSGDLAQRGPHPLRVALEHPLDPTQAIGVAEISDAALCASASNRRSWADTHHVIDALTGLPTTEVIATWVVAGDALTADGLATALFFTRSGPLAERFDFEFVRMFADGTTDRSPGFPGEVFTR